MRKPQTNQSLRLRKRKKTENDLPAKARDELNPLMNQGLADAIDLQMHFFEAYSQASK